MSNPDLRFLASWASKMESRIEIRVNEGVKNVAYEVLKVLITSTPVDTSQALSNWRVGLGQRVSGNIKPHFKGFAGSTRSVSEAIAIAAGKTIIKNRKPRQVIHISNNLPYIEALDAGTISLQPGAMVAKAIAIGNGHVKAIKLHLDK